MQKKADALEVSRQVLHLRRALAKQFLILRFELRIRELLVSAAKRRGYGRSTVGALSIP